MRWGAGSLDGDPSPGDVVARTRAEVYGTPALVALAFSTTLAFARPSCGDELAVAVQKTFDAFCGLNLRYIEQLFDAAVAPRPADKSRPFK